MRLPAAFAQLALFLFGTLVLAVPAPSEFVLKTAVHPGEDTTKNDLYLGAYHPGAGTDHLVFWPNPDVNIRRKIAVPFVLDRGWLRWGAAFNAKTMWMHQDGWNQGWDLVSLTVGDLDTLSRIRQLLKISNNTLVAEPELNGFKGWLVCDWFHGIPQLFYKTGGFYEKHLTPSSNEHDKQHVLPSTCASVDLVVEKYEPDGIIVKRGRSRNGCLGKEAYSCSDSTADEVHNLA